MNHDELLAKIDATPHQRFASEENAKYRNALRAVVELHKPAEVAPSVCAECTQIISMKQKENIYVSNSILVDYPCPTIQAIQEQLK